MDQKQLATLLANAIEELAINKAIIPDALIDAYNAIEENHRRAMAVFTLAEQSQIPETERDPRYKWLGTEKEDLQ